MTDYKKWQHGFETYSGNENRQIDGCDVLVRAKQGAACAP